MAQESVGDIGWSLEFILAIICAFLPTATRHLVDVFATRHAAAKDRGHQIDAYAQNKRPIQDRSTISGFCVPA